MSNNQEPNNPGLTESKTKARKRKLLKLGAGVTAAITLAASGVAYAVTRGSGAPKPNLAATKHEKHETSSTPIEAYNAFAKDLIDGKIPVRVLAATVTFSLSGQKDKYGRPDDRLLGMPFPGAVVNKSESPENPLYFTAPLVGVAKFQGHDYLYGCDITSKQDDANKINPNDIYAGCLQRIWGQDGHQNYMLFIDLANPPEGLKILTDQSVHDGQLYPGQLFEPQSDIARKLVGPSFSEGYGFEFTFSQDPSQNNFLAENSQEIPISTVISQLG